MILAFDTSCYTTSVAIMDLDGRLLSNKQRLLHVKKGNLGLRQSEAFFQHNQNLPQLLAEALTEAQAANAIKFFAAAATPRPQAGSYMPVFMAGANLALNLSMVNARPKYLFSHQEGHIAAGLYSADLNWQQPFLAIHISGGTTEILYIKPKAQGFDIEICSDCDLAAGQFVDRIGVALGLDFPAGKALEQLALSMPPGDLRLKTAVKGNHISFSGAETAAERLIGKQPPAAIAQAVFFNIGRSLAKALQILAKQKNCYQVLLVGGVASNSIIKAKLKAELANFDLQFAQPKLACDNAVGIAALALDYIRKQALSTDEQDAISRDAGGYGAGGYDAGGQNASGA